MKPCIRLEIIIEAALSRKLIEILETADAPGFTMFPELRGKGDRGVRWADEPSRDSSNCMFLIACDEDAVVEDILEKIRPLLTSSGGVCLVSEANWLRH